MEQISNNTHSIRYREIALKTLCEETFEVVVVGGGITGSCVARDLALRGLKTALIEKDDFASGTSSKSGKLVHGGFRYLKYFHFKLVFESCLERSRLVKIVAPHVVKPTKFLIPFYKRNHVGRFLVFLALVVYDVIGLFSSGLFLNHLVSKSKLRKLEPNLRDADCTGALQFEDCTCVDSRFVIDTVKSFTGAKGTAINYVEFLGINENTEGSHISCLDRLSKKAFSVKTKVLINATGAWADDVLLKSKKEKFNLKISSGIHLLFSREKLPINHTLTFESTQDSRYLYAVPWGPVVLVGTTDRYYESDKEMIPLERIDVNYILESLNFYFPQTPLTFIDVQSAFCGIRPLVGSNEGLKEEAMPRDYEIKIEGSIISVTGGKMTTARLMAEKVADTTIKTHFSSRKDLQKCKTISPISGGQRLNQDDLLKLNNKYSKLLNAHLDTLLKRYGSNAVPILNMIDQDHNLAQHFVNNFSLIRAEVKYFVIHEFCQKINDVLLRRTTSFLQAPDQGKELAPKVAAYMGSLLNWSESVIQNELSKYEQEIHFSKKELR